MAHDVFISYSSRDKTVADTICSFLEQRGIRCWMAPRDILPGDEWGTAIIHAISASRILILVFSNHSNLSKQVMREVGCAINHEVYLLPFRIEDIQPTGAMEYYLSSQHWLDALTKPLELQSTRLAETVEAILKAPPLKDPATGPSKPDPVNREEKSDFMGRIDLTRASWEYGRETDQTSSAGNTATCGLTRDRKAERAADCTGNEGRERTDTGHGTGDQPNEGNVGAGIGIAIPEFLKEPPFSLGNTINNIQLGGIVTALDDGVCLASDKGVFVQPAGNSQPVRLASRTARYVNYMDGWIYYSSAVRGGGEDEDGPGLSLRGIYRIRPDGSDLTKLSDEVGFYLTVTNQYLYFQDGETDANLYRMNPDGSAVRKLEAGLVNRFFLFEGKLFYVPAKKRRGCYCLHEYPGGRRIMDVDTGPEPMFQLFDNRLFLKTYPRSGFLDNFAGGRLLKYFEKDTSRLISISLDFNEETVYSRRLWIENCKEVDDVDRRSVEIEDLGSLEDIKRFIMHRECLYYPEFSSRYNEEMSAKGLHRIGSKYVLKRKNLFSRDPAANEYGKELTVNTSELGICGNNLYYPDTSSETGVSLLGLDP